jgi:hypothetical protein
MITHQKSRQNWKEYIQLCKTCNQEELSYRLLEIKQNNSNSNIVDLIDTYGYNNLINIYNDYHTMKGGNKKNNTNSKGIFNSLKKFATSPKAKNLLKKGVDFAKSEKGQKLLAQGINNLSDGKGGIKIMIKQMLDEIIKNDIMPELEKIIEKIVKKIMKDKD